MTYFQKFKGHLSTVLAHRHAVFQACIKAGQFWRGFNHDLSKFSPTEFFQYVKYFEVGKSPRDVALDMGEQFTAWRHHVGHNPHHWEYWVDNQKGVLVPLEMPTPYFIEMICDWIGANKTYATRKGQTWDINELHTWYNKTKDHQLFAEVTLQRVQYLMKLRDEQSIYAALRMLK